MKILEALIMAATAIENLKMPDDREMIIIPVQRPMNVLPMAGMQIPQKPQFIELRFRRSKNGTWLLDAIDGKQIIDISKDL